MAELEIDQSHLPRVQEVRQSFAVLEDSVLAHSLQEQEIEHYYSSNIQKNQLVQNDMRVAKQLQGEEEQQREQQRAQLQQASQQLEEQDSEYARLIQEELQRCAEEARRRELEDEEIAKRIQEEEEQRGKSRGQEGLSDDADSSPAVPSPHQHTLGHLQLADAQHRPSAATRWQYSASRTWSDLTEAEFHRGIADRKETTPRSNEGHRQCVRRSRDEFRERLSEDSDMVFYKELTGRSQRPHKRADSAPCHQWLFEREPRQRNCRSLQSERPLKEEHRGWPGDWRALGEDSECDEPEVRMPRNREWERNLRKEDVGWHGEIDHESDHRSVEGRARRCSRSQSVRLPDRQRDADATRTWSPREPPDRHVRFQDQSRLSDCLHDNGTSRVWEMLGQVLRERGVAVRHGVGGAPQPAPASPGPQSRHGQALHWSDASHGDPQPHPRAFDRSASTRHSYHGNARRCTPSSRMSSDCDYRGSQAKPHGFVPTAEDGGTVHSAVPSRDSEMANGERRGSGRWHGAELRHGAENGREGKKKGGSDPARGLSRSTSERWHQHKGAEELSPREDEGPRLRGPRRSFSLSGRGVSTRVGWRHAMAGATLQPPPREVCLDLGELQQVLQDEELARRLQEQEDRLVRRGREVRESSPISHPEGDFRVAQVAQDEEIARFMQKQEIKSKRRSRELEGPASWREHREMMSLHDKRAARERQGQWERLDSEGLPSPTEDYSPDNEPPSPISTITQAQQMRNIAEELDPTFKTRRQDGNTLQTGQTGPPCQSLPVSQSGLHDVLEEPTFIPPTKRQSEKSGRTKPKEKKENCKQQ